MSIWTSGSHSVIGVGQLIIILAVSLVEDTLESENTPSKSVEITVNVHARSPPRSRYMA